MSDERKIGQFRVRDKRKKGWFFVDDEYLNGFARIFGAVGTAIYISLCRHTDIEEQSCFPSQELIAEELSIGTTTVKKYIKLFEKYQLIYIERQRDKITKKWLNNIYWLLDKAEWKKPGSASVYGEPGTLRCKSQGRQVSNKDIHCIKEIHKYIRIDNQFLNEKLGQHAPKDVIKAVLRIIPQNSWCRVEAYLRKHYPGNGAIAFEVAERELIAEARQAKDAVGALTAGIGH
jgi:hypothetical protein